MGLAPLDSQTVQLAKKLGSTHVVVQGQIITAEVNGIPLFMIQWDPASRQVVADLAAKYGYAVSPDVLARIEEWISSSNVDITARYGNDVSKPLMVNLTKPVLVDVGSAGQVTVEKIPLAMMIDAGAVQIIKQGQIRNAVLCWNQGTLTAQVDGQSLPQVTLDPKGVQLMNDRLGLHLDKYLDSLFAGLLGADISFPGGAHNVRATCGR